MCETLYEVGSKIQRDQFLTASDESCNFETSEFLSLLPLATGGIAQQRVALIALTGIAGDGGGTNACRLMV